jgi:hypothetical protein
VEADPRHAGHRTKARLRSDQRPSSASGDQPPPCGNEPRPRLRPRLH